MTQTVINGACTRLLHLSSSGGAIFAILPVGTAKTVRIVASSKSMPFAPSIGEYLSIWGEFVSDRKYGLQLHAVNVVRSLPSGQGIVGLLSKHPEFAWLSALSAKRLWKVLGEALYDALSEPNIQALAEGANISSRYAMTLVKCWRQYSLDLDVLSFLEMHDLPRELVHSVSKYWGRRFREALTTNPYILVPLSTWSKIDRSCTSYRGIPHKMADRLIAACISSAEDALAQNNEIAITARELTERVTRKLGSKYLANKALELSKDSGHLHMFRENDVTIFQTKGRCCLHSALRRRISEFAKAASEASDHVQEPNDVQRHLHGVVVWNDFDRVASIPFLREFKGAEHIFPSISTGLQFFECRSKFKIFSEIDNAHDFIEPWAGQYYIIHGVENLGLIAINRILHYIPERHTVLLVPSSCVPADTPNQFWRWLLSLPDVNRASTLRWLPPLRNKIREQERVNLSLAAPLTIGPGEAVSVRLLVTAGFEPAMNATLRAYRQAAHQHTALIVTGAKATCKRLNQALHSEAIELREFEGQTALSMKLRNGAEATVGDRIVAIRANYENKILVGAFGVVTEIYSTMNFGINEGSVANVITATVLLDTVGLTQLTFADCALFDLGYAVPIELDIWSAFDHRIFYIDKPDLSINHLYSLITRTKRSVSFLGEKEHLAALSESSQQVFAE